MCVCRTDFAAPCRTSKYPREIPELPWYRSTVPQMVLAGFLPFSAIYVELYYIFASVWGHKVGGLALQPPGKATKQCFSQPVINEMGSFSHSSCG